MGLLVRGGAWSGAGGFSLRCASGADITAQLSTGSKMHVHGLSRTLSSAAVWCGFDKVAFDKSF